MDKPHNIDDYIAGFPVEIQALLERMRTIIREAAPGAQEKISYAMPTFYQQGNLVHFAAFKGHIGFYPAPSAIQAFKEELAAYKTSKGAVQLPMDQPLPVALITKMVKYRVRENLQKSKYKKR